MRRSRWILLVVILTIVAVFIAKETVKHGERASPTESQGEAQNPTAQLAPGGSALGSGESKGTPASTPSLEGNPGSIGGASPDAEEAAGQPASGNQSAAESANPRSAPSGTTSGKKPEGHLPGSKLAACLKSGRPTMADFGKGWCVPCKMMVPVLKQAAQDYWGKTNIVFVELDEYADLGRGYRIATMPTQIFFNAKGEEVSRHMGYMGTEDIERKLATLGVKK